MKRDPVVRGSLKATSVDLESVRSVDELAQILEAEGVQSPFLETRLASLPGGPARRFPQAVEMIDELLDTAAVELVRDLFDPKVRDRIRQADRATREALLKVLLAGLRAAPASRQALAMEPPKAAPLSEPAPRERTALIAWARKAGIEEHLDDPAAVLRTRIPPKHRWLADQRTTVAEMRTFTGICRIYSSNQDLKKACEDAAAEYLQDMIAAVREGIAEEEALFRDLPIPEDPALKALRVRLLAARDPIRARRTPRPRRLLRDIRLALIPDPPTLQFEETRETPSSTNGFESSKVRVTIDLLAGDADFVRCTCSGARSPTCKHALEALTEALGAIVAKDADRIAKVLTAPAWERFLDSLGGFADRLGSENENAEKRLSWRVDAGPGHLLTLRPAVQKRLKRGGYSKGQELEPYNVHESEDLELTDVDARALRLLRYGGYHDEAAVRLALVELAGHPYVFLRSDPEIRLDVREESLALAARERENGAYELVARVGDREISPSRIQDWVQSVGSGDLHVEIDRERGLCTLVRVSRRAAEMLWLVGRSRGTIPAEARESLLATLSSVQRHVPVELPPDLLGTAAPADGRTLLRLLPAQNGLRVEARVRPAPAGRTFVPGEGPAVTPGRQGATVVSVRRDLGAEEGHARATLTRLGIREEQRINGFDYLVEGPDALELVARASGGGAGFVVEWPEAEWRVLRASPRDLKVRVEKRHDWFGVEGEIEVDGHAVALAAVLAALRREERFVEVRPGMWIALEGRLREMLQEAADVLEERRDGLEAGVGALRCMEDLAHDAGKFDVPAEWDAITERMRLAASMEARLPKELVAELRPYQIEGFRWLARIAEWGVGGVLADDMGLGKTLQAIALLARRASAGPALVIAPTSVCSNWVSEAAKFAPSLRFRLYREESSIESRAALLESLGPGDVLVVSYGLVTRDAERFAARTFATLVLDEAQALKNAATQRARAVRDLSAGFRVALSGTPMENHLGELWSVFRCVFPSLLGSHDRFRERFALPIERDRNPARREALARLVRPFLLRRTKAEVAPELPARTEIRVDVDLSPDERRLYDAERLSSLEKMDGPESGASAIDVLAAITRLRQLACHPRLHDSESPVPSSKLDRFLELIDELRAEGHRALVFSQFTKHLALVRNVLEERGIRYEYLDGATPPDGRDAAVRAFQADGGADLFLISLKAGGTGLNLTAADYVIHLDPWWNPAAEDQATDRAHRIGQTRPVTVLRLVSRDTIEEKILALHAEKRDLVAGVLAGGGAATRMSTEELLALLRER